jgi:type III restriction enzyme
VHTLYDLKIRRVQEVDFYLAKLLLERYFLDAEGHSRPWLFPQLVGIARRWREECLVLKDHMFPQVLLFRELADDAVEKIYQAIVLSTSEDKTLKAILRPYDTIGSTRYVDFDTTRPVYATDPEKCHVSHVVADTESWEQKMAQALEAMPEVKRYVKNQGLGCTIPYTFMGQEGQYVPDFLVQIEDGHGDEELLNLIIEVSGEARADKAAKVAAARNLWVPAINHHGGFGRWAFLEIIDPWDAQKTIRSSINRTLVDDVLSNFQSG